MPLKCACTIAYPNACELIYRCASNASMIAPTTSSHQSRRRYVQPLMLLVATQPPHGI